MTNLGEHGRTQPAPLTCTAVALGALWLLLLPAALPAQEPADYFRQNCVNCHTIGGGRLTGPDLRNVEQRKDREWLMRFLLSPKAVLDAGDPYALKLQQDARGVVMPTVGGMSRERAVALLDLVAAESKLDKSQFSGIQISDRPFTPAEVDAGRRLFTGVAALRASGASCISCHAVKGTGALGGGRLGPDLTRVYERLQGRRGLASWLMAPATPTMQAVFKKRPLTSEEIVPLVAFFEDSARQGGEADHVGPLNFFLLGLGGAAVGLIVFDSVWKRRFRAVRRPLVDGAEGAGRGGDR